MPDATSLIIERLRIEEVINQLFVATDRRDWAAVRACFAPEVRFDMTSLAGGAPTTMTPAQIAAACETGLAPIRVLLRDRPVTCGSSLRAEQIYREQRSNGAQREGTVVQIRARAPGSEQ